MTGAQSTSWSLTTRLLNADRGLGDDLGVSPPIHQSVNFVATDPDHLAEISRPLGDRYYARRGNPTASRIAKVIADLEGAETGMMFASGMAAMSTAVLALVGKGDHVIAQRNHYIGITELIDGPLLERGVETTRVDQRSADDFARAIRPNTRLIILESPVNPLLHVTDFRAVCDLARAHGIVTICDNTFATPINQRPIALGVDVVMHSVTKYIGGHHDLLGGCIVGPQELLERIWNLSMMLGGAAAPFNAWLALRGIRTLELRMERHNANALALARLLETHPAVATVFYPGLASHPQHALAASQMSGFGGLLSFDLKGGYEAGQTFIRSSELISYASSLGGVSSTIVQPSVLFGGRLPAEMVERQGITPGLLRLATGIENTADLLADVGQALDRIGR